ncbi:molybdate ABC transporter substrate-binding protein [Alloiococcus sp. CFN-8]|uniref:molybdate ABC transporter substrate-binding protein n=1 Tax=Alloiococcus sp. CFN-8 TaxID=3416081 RepID=UPI003CEBED7E
MKRKAYIYILLIAAIISSFTGCGSKEAASKDSGKKDVSILIAAAASLEASLEKSIIPLFEENHPDIKVQGTYDGSGKLALQIQEGIPGDIFISAAASSMEVLKGKELIYEDSIVELLENKLVLIVPKASRGSYKSFEDIINAKTIAIGDPASVPAGQYAKEVLEAMGLWEEVSQRASLGTNVTEVLQWVAEGSAEAGLVYATDAALEGDKVEVIEEAQEEFLKSRIIYPAGIIRATENKETAEEFLDFLASEEVKEIFKSYGFYPAE